MFTDCLMKPIIRSVQMIRVVEYRFGRRESSPEILKLVGAQPFKKDVN